MKGLLIDLKRERMITEEEKRSTVETIQFGTYGASQSFELDIGKKGKAKAVDSEAMLEEVRSLFSRNEDIIRLNVNRIERSLEMVERFPESHIAWLNLAIAYVNGANMEDARKAAEKALELAPEAASAKAVLGRILILQGDAEEALAIYREILAAQGDNIAAIETAAMLELVLGRVDKAIEELRTATKKTTKKRLSLYYNLGVAHLVKGKWGRAISYFRKTVREDPHYYMAYGGMGVAYSIMGQQSKAEKMFRIAADLEPRDAGMRLNLCRALTVQKKWSDTIEELTKLVQDFPRYWKAIEALGRLYFSLGRFREARVRFDRIRGAIEAGDYKGDLSNACNNVGVALLFEGKIEAAERVLRQSIEISNRQNISALMNLTRLCLRARRLERAGQLLDELKEKAGKDNIEMLHLSSAYYQILGDYERAIEELRRVLVRDVNNVRAVCSEAAILVDAYGEYEEAEKMLRSAMVGNETNALLMNNLAYTLLLRGKTADAKPFLDKMVPREEIREEIILATKGLWHIKRGEIAEGTRLYNVASNITEDQELAKLITQKKELELGRWYKDQGRKEQAKRHLGRAIEIDSLDTIHRRGALKLLDEMK